MGLGTIRFADKRTFTPCYSVLWGTRITSTRTREKKKKSTALHEETHLRLLARIVTISLQVLGRYLG